MCKVTVYVVTDIIFVYLLHDMSIAIFIFHVFHNMCHPYIPVYTVLYHLLNILIIGPTSTTGTNRPSRG